MSGPAQFSTHHTLTFSSSSFSFILDSDLFLLLFSKIHALRRLFKIYEISSKSTNSRYFMGYKQICKPGRCASFPYYCRVFLRRRIWIVPPRACDCCKPLYDLELLLYVGVLSSLFRSRWRTSFGSFLLPIDLSVSCKYEVVIDLELFHVELVRNDLKVRCCYWIKWWCSRFFEEQMIIPESTCSGLLLESRQLTSVQTR